MFDLMCDTSTCWHRQWLSGRRRFGGGVVSGTRAVDHQKNGSKHSLQSLERWPQERSLTPFDHIFIVILHGPLRFREESGSGCARSWSGALDYPANQTGLSRTLWSGHAPKLSFSVVFFFSGISSCTDTSRFVGVNFVPSMVTVNLSNNALHADHVVLFYLLCDDDPHLRNNEQKTS